MATKPSVNSQKLRFMVVGGANTAIDFGLLFLLKTLGLPTVPANIISTTAAFCFSFFANKQYTFKSSDTNIAREITLFIVVTLFGLWVLQTIVIQLVVPFITPMGWSQDINLLIAKVCATVVTLVWNYSMYSKVVFKASAKKS